MSGEPPKKRSKNTFKNNKGSKWKWTKPNRKSRIEIGDKGFLATCNFREKDCERESYNLLNTYADQLYGKTDESGATKTEVHEDGATKTDETEDDISTELQNEIDAINSSNKMKLNRFQHVDSETSNLVFIKTTLKDPVELGKFLIEEIASSKKSVSRFILRFIPIEVVCKANIEDIKTAAGKLFDKYFLNCPPKSYSIIINKRYNNNINRDEIINELAGLVNFKNVQHKVDLKHAECSIVVEILKGICCLSVLPNYLKYKKYNISELLSDKSPKKDKVNETVSAVESDDKVGKDTQEDAGE